MANRYPDRRKAIYYHVAAPITCAMIREEWMAHGRTVVGVITALALACAPAARADTKVRVGQPQAGTFQFVPLQVGIEAGIFKKPGVDIEVSSFSGGPRVQQAIAADSIDIGLGSAPSLPSPPRARPKSASPPWRTRPIRCCSRR